MIPDSLLPTFVALLWVAVVVSSSIALSKVLTAANKRRDDNEATFAKRQSDEIDRINKRAIEDRQACNEEIARLETRVAFLEGQTHTLRTDYITLYVIAKDIRNLCIEWGAKLSQNLRVVPVIPPIPNPQTKPLHPVTVRLKREQLHELQQILLTGIGMDTREGRSLLLTGIDENIVNQIIRSDAASIDMLAIVGTIYRAGNRHLITLYQTAEELFQGSDIVDRLNEWWDKTYTLGEL